MVTKPLAGKDTAQEYLVPYLAETECIFSKALQTYDKSASCRITPAADLCVPHDVIRIAGGFATGCLVEWQRNVPVVPIDTTVNIDITSLYALSETTRDRFNSEVFDRLRSVIDNSSSYEWNFHKGNHFIASVQRSSDGQNGLLFHSNEKEFKYQFNGLMPVPRNWYWDDVFTHEFEGRYIRLLVGKKAELFYSMSKMLHEFTVLRHSFLANQILSRDIDIESEQHNFHYYMPGPQSVAIGCYICDVGEQVPILSRPGRPIDIFVPREGGLNAISMLDGQEKLIVPHGWGKTSSEPIVAKILDGTYEINGMSFPIEPKATLGRHPGLVLREFADNLTDPASLYARMSAHCPGDVVERWHQNAYYNKDGIVSV